MKERLNSAEIVQMLRDKANANAGPASFYNEAADLIERLEGALESSRKLFACDISPNVSKAVIEVLEKRYPEYAAWLKERETRGEE